MKKDDGTIYVHVSTFFFSYKILYLGLPSQYKVDLIGFLLHFLRLFVLKTFIYDDKALCTHPFVLLCNKQARMCNKLRLSLNLLHIGLGLPAAIFGPLAHLVLYLRSAPLNPTPPNHFKILYIEIGVRIYKQTNN